MQKEMRVVLECMHVCMKVVRVAKVLSLLMHVCRLAVPTKPVDVQKWYGSRPVNARIGAGGWYEDAEDPLERSAKFRTAHRKAIAS